jgi:hypothetical protein
MSAIPYINRDGAFQPRAFLQTAMSMASLHLDHATDHLATNDDIALKRSLEKFGACVKAMLDTVPAVFAEEKADG